MSKTGLEPDDCGSKGKHSRALGCGAVLLLCCLSLLAYIGWANTLPPPEPDVVRVLPNPNGYDACAKVVAKLSGIGAAAVDDPGTADLVSLRKAVKDAGPLLEELGTAVRLSYLLPSGVRIESSDYRHATRLLVAKARVELADGKVGTAMDTSLDAIELGVKYSRGGAWFHSVIGTSLSRLGLRSAEPVVDRLSAAEARAALARLDHILQEVSAPAEVMEEERRMISKEVRLALGKPGQPIQLGQSENEPDWVYHSREGVLRALYPRRLGYHRIQSYYSDMVREMRKPIKQRVPPVTPSDPVINDWMVPFRDYEYRITRPQADLRLLRWQLALREHRMRTGRYPDALPALPPNAPPAGGQDPFTERPFVYRRQGSGYLLYSVGPDGRDDGGVPVTGKALNQIDAKGDLVAGQLSSNPAPGRR